MRLKNRFRERSCDAIFPPCQGNWKAALDSFCGEMDGRERQWELRREREREESEQAEGESEQ